MTKKIQNYITTSNNYGKLTILIGVLIAFPMLVVPFFTDESEYLTAFLLPSVILVALGLIVCLAFPNKEKLVTVWRSPLQNGSLPVLFTWGLAVIAGAFPFMLGGQFDGVFLHAFFESVSGWTTTGLSLADVAIMPRIFLFYRAFMQFCGGIGFIIMIAMLIRGKQTFNLYNTEGHTDRIMPSITKTAQLIFMLYCGLLIAGILAYSIYGMPMFDAICHAMSAVSTAGFSTQANSIGEYNSAAIEIITIILMLFGSTNFAVILLLFRGKFRRLSRVSEARFMLGVVFMFSTLVAFSLIRYMEMGLATGTLNALFAVISTFTSSGYSVFDYYVELPPFATGLLFLLMFIGGSAGSTAGGIKLIRTYLLLQAAKENVKSKLSPSRRVTQPVFFRTYGKIPIDDKLIKDTLGFVACYMVVYICGVLLLTLTSGALLFDAMFEFASALGTTGLSNGLTSVETPPLALFVLIAGMLLGRLEILIIFAGIYTIMRAIRLK
ncbi:MAG: TrkH family potassium uptake protein [Oscillospiraceae bacterium]|nr:TrkH family potassium uptake protein [Oscillospiraceae bacterium]